MPIRKIARAIGTAGRDASRARHAASSPEFRRDVARDRRATLSQFDTVKQALRDRERIEKARVAAKKGGNKANGKKGSKPA